MSIWYEYRGVWAARPWVLAVLVLGVLMIVAGIVGTVARDDLAILFVPGLAVTYIHHLLVTRRYN